MDATIQYYALKLKDGAGVRIMQIVPQFFAVYPETSEPVKSRFENGIYVVAEPQLYEDKEGFEGFEFSYISPEEFIAKFPESDQVAIESFRQIELADIPTSRVFRNAWTDDQPTQTVDVDMDKARSIHMNRIRSVRQEKFIELGFPFRLDPDVEAAIVPNMKRIDLQKLRDIPQVTDLSGAKTPDDLQAIWPEMIERRAAKRHNEK